MSLQDFALEVAREEAHIDLARASLMIAEDVYPRLDLERYVDDIESMAMRLCGRVPPKAPPAERIDALNRLLFDELGYTGNSDDYYDPRNSYLNEVIERRTGIPITLSLLYMEVGRRAGLPLEGVSFPGHFLVRVQVSGGVLVLDPFAAGAPQSEADLRERLKRVIPEGAAIEVPVSDLPLDQFLEAATKRQILARMLRNLKAIYAQKDEPERVLQVLNRMVVVAPEASGELRDRGYVHERLECWQAALKDLTEYLEREPDAPDFDEVRARMIELKARCARIS